MIDLNLLLSILIIIISAHTIIYTFYTYTHIHGEYKREEGWAGAMGWDGKRKRRGVDERGTIDDYGGIIC